ncbi:MAG: hypothetical protein D6691_12670 [Candidatus Hydrogenedentota bacterium]|uniref:Uncharacterized protein n=1 Tax=Sumerlaea chitinivorans TaxID=2250252 RepID=A0A2Z4Y1I7_SUMC1|nr:hypothetical protein BRCON_0117 [Candidatus Sumerlaea chitinivorans]MCX7962950.1 hypothetical protein [Candidatus Sumerlaea chitinivorans]RMH23797.1 MAG: hypothetical protein D6691_12670 [Candidatus Hydrogenedentota bacterium]
MEFLPKRPEVLAIRRGEPEKISVGDEAWCRHVPGLLAHLMEEVTPGVRRGSGAHPMTGLPIGMAIHAAIVACDGERTGIGVCRALHATLESPMGPWDSVRSYARIEEIGRRHVTCLARAYAEETPLRLLAELQVVLVKVENGRAVPIKD